MFQTLFGPVKLERAYYRCAGCQCGLFPFDARLQLNQHQQSPAVQELTALAGVQCDFQSGARLLEKMSGVQLSESTTQRLTEDAGARLKELQEQQVKLGTPEPWQWQPDREGKACGYISIDATGVPQQGAKAEKHEARMANVARLFTAKLPEKEGQQQEPPRVERSWFFAGHCSLDELRQNIQQAAGQVGAENAERWICLSDGGSGLERCLSLCFPFTEVILDYWHAREYLVDLAKVLRPSDEAERKAWVDKMSHRLKHQGGNAVLAELEALNNGEQRTGVQEELGKVIRYYRNQQHRMKYPEYRAKGWQIGSGAVESACKQVVKARLAGSGMRWRETGSDATCRLRALWLSDPLHWDAFWALAP